MLDDIQTAIGFVRRDIPGAEEVDLHELAARHGYKWVFTVRTETDDPALAARILSHHAQDWEPDAVVVPGFEHIEPLRSHVTQFAALITPMQLYPQGYQWPASARMEA